MSVFALGFPQGLGATGKPRVAVGGVRLQATPMLARSSPPDALGCQHPHRRPLRVRQSTPAYGFAQGRFWIATAPCQRGTSLAA